jgi:hypothetical protein
MMAGSIDSCRSLLNMMVHSHDNDLDDWAGEEGDKVRLYIVW